MDDNWERSAGEICPACGKEAWRFAEGLCFPCARKKVEQNEKGEEDKRLRRYYRRALLAGKISLKEMREGRL